MRLIEVNDKKTESAFLKVPKTIYANDPVWVPHLKQDVEKVFDPQKATASSKKAARPSAGWPRTMQGQWVGRVAAFVSPKYSGGHGAADGRARLL